MRATVAIIGAARFPPERMAEVRPHLKTLVDATRTHDDCLAYDVGEDPFDPGVIRFSELWPDHEALQRHLRAPHIRPWVEAAHRCGLVDETFIAYDLAGSREV